MAPRSSAPVTCGRRGRTVRVWPGGRIGWLVAATACLMFAASSVCIAPPPAAVGHSFQSRLPEPSGGRLEEPAALAVDRSDGRVFVSDVEAGVVDVYDSSGAFLTQLGDGELDGVGVAVDEASGLVYVADTVRRRCAGVQAGRLGRLRTDRGMGQAKGCRGKGFGEVTGVAVDNSGGPSAGDCVRGGRGRRSTSTWASWTCSSRSRLEPEEGDEGVAGPGALEG